MSKTDILNYFYMNSTDLDAITILTIMGIGLLMAAIIYITYKFTYTGVAYSAKFNASNVAILLITIVIMLMISSNIVISLGMVGALSIIRFRTAVKDPRDTVFIFWSIVEGLSVGSQNFKLSIVSTLVIALVIFIMSFSHKRNDKYLLIVRGDEQLQLEEIEQILKKQLRKYSMKAYNASDRTEVIFEMRAKENQCTAVVKDVKALQHAISVNLLLETGETVG